MTIKLLEKAIGQKLKRLSGYYNYGAYYYNDFIIIDFGIYTTEGGHRACCDLRIRNSDVSFNEMSHHGFGCTNINQARGFLSQVKNESFKKAIEYLNKDT